MIVLNHVQYGKHTRGSSTHDKALCNDNGRKRRNGIATMRNDPKKSRLRCALTPKDLRRTCFSSFVSNDGKRDAEVHVEFFKISSVESMRWALAVVIEGEFGLIIDVQRPAS
jgi:hypothetical protein